MERVLDPSNGLQSDLLKLATDTAFLTANTGNSYTVTSNGSLAGAVRVQNTSGGTLTSMTAIINNSLVTANSIILTWPHRDSTSAAGVGYAANEDVALRTAGSFSVLMHRVSISASSQFAINEGLTIHYVIIN